MSVLCGTFNGVKYPIIHDNINDFSFSLCLLIGNWTLLKLNIIFTVLMDYLRSFFQNSLVFRLFLHVYIIQ